MVSVMLWAMWMVGYLFHVIRYSQADCLIVLLRRFQSDWTFSVRCAMGALAVGSFQLLVKARVPSFEGFGRARMSVGWVFLCKNSTAWFGLAELFWVSKSLTVLALCLWAKLDIGWESARSVSNFNYFSPQFFEGKFPKKSDNYCWWWFVFSICFWS